MSGRWNNGAAATIAAAGLVLATAAHASSIEERVGEAASWARWPAGAQLRVPKGWSARLFVTPPEVREARIDATPARSASIHAQVARQLDRTTRLSLDVFNVFDHPVREVDGLAAARGAAPAGMGEHFLTRPAEGRGILLRLRKTF